MDDQELRRWHYLKETQLAEFKERLKELGHRRPELTGDRDSDIIADYFEPRAGGRGARKGWP